MSSLHVPPQARVHLLGAVVVVALALLCFLAMTGEHLHQSFTRILVLFGGLLVTLVLLLHDQSDRAILAYGAGFFAAFAVIAAIAA
jgi:heme/copper-type cytochrome/quinol oxidase subunit 4